MFPSIRRWRRRRVLEQHALPDALVEQAFSAQWALQRLDGPDRRRLRELATLFLHDRDVYGAGGLEPEPGMAVEVALVGCLPVLNLGLDWYRDVRTLVLYPGDFVARHRYQDEAGIEHDEESVMAGEAWERGPVVLSWANVEASRDADGFNVVLHEFAHKLDMVNGEANGHPPLHRGMDRQRWTRAFFMAYERLCAELDAGGEPWIDPYAAESPAEFFSVLSEAFFELPWLLKAEEATVYEQLALFYRQDPAAGMKGPVGYSSSSPSSSFPDASSVCSSPSS
ncbi:MAG: zinc-dependent peptidase [Ectothiorhodospiraceae bacterium]|nr:zinc-dependent peptidase [Ectothiorhodospiraceae bacterium]